MRHTTNETTSTRPARASRLRIAAALLGVAALSACAADSALGPHDEHATMQMAAKSVAASAIGQTVALDATVLNMEGQPLRGAQVHWDLSATDVLQPIGGGRFLVLKEGTVQVAAIWPKDPSVRATVTVTVDAGLLASACIVKSDQSTTSTNRCAQKRVVVRVAPFVALEKTPGGAQ
jgi:hypothetical protein